MTLPEQAYTQFTDDLRICRLLNGMWQVSGGHGEIDRGAALEAMMAYHDDGFTTWDLADHYGPAEDFIGEFRKRLAKAKGEAALGNVQAFTKWVPRPVRISAGVVEKAVKTSMERMGVEQIDLMQFHWWEYRDSGYLSALNQLAFMVRKGVIKALGLTNFDTRHMRNLQDNGIWITSNQVQFSIIDRRPEVQMIPFNEENDVKLLAYGTLAGGLLTDRYLDQPEPGRDQLTTASLRKYKGMIDQWGDWTLFQELLGVLRGVADQYNVSIANVATRYVLDKSTVAGVIVGARLGVSDNREENKRVFDFALTDDDLDKIHEVTDKANDLFKIIGDCGAEYRR
jgi:aryl-alcohol dehydrogenase-like predicted oxidoreductase